MSKELEALECLDKLAKQIELDEDTDYWEIRNAHITVEQALLKAEKEHKALWVIKEKNVDVFRFKKLDFNTFNQLQKSCKLPELTKEEFNLLKEMLE